MFSIYLFIIYILFMLYIDILYTLKLEETWFQVISISVWLEEAEGPYWLL
jgi:hypothetical protein